MHISALRSDHNVSTHVDNERTGKHPLNGVNYDHHLCACTDHSQVLCSRLSLRFSKYSQLSQKMNFAPASSPLGSRIASVISLMEIHRPITIARHQWYDKKKTLWPHVKTYVEKCSWLDSVERGFGRRCQECRQFLFGSSPVCVSPLNSCSSVPILRFLLWTSSGFSLQFRIKCSTDRVVVELTNRRVIFLVRLG